MNGREWGMIGERREIRDPDHVFEGAGTKESRQTTENRGLRLYLGFKWRNKAQIMPQPHNSLSFPPFYYLALKQIMAK